MHEHPNAIELEDRRETMTTFRTVKIAEGIGYGQGPISGEELMAEAGLEAVQAGERLINSPDILVPLDRDENGEMVEDDGCGDGRGVKRIFKGIFEKARSLNRAKVFGGGSVMTAATLIGLNKANGLSGNGLLAQSIHILKEKMIDFGGHTADHVAPGREDRDSGCGAIDGLPEIVALAAPLSQNIVATVESLSDDTASLDEVMTGFVSYAESIKGQDYRGKQAVEEIIDNGKIVKQLEGPHREAWIVLNTVRGYTVDQKALRQATGGRLDAFAVDVWRLQDYADKLYDTTDDRRKAYLSELVYTLLTAAKLTKGDLPVYLLEHVPQPVAV